MKYLTLFVFGFCCLGRAHAATVASCVYEVPVQDESLVGAARLPLLVPTNLLSPDGKARGLEFACPEDLCGPNVLEKFEEKVSDGNSTVLVTPLGSEAACDVSGQRLLCRLSVKYAAPISDIVEGLRRKYLPNSPQLFREKEAVARIYRGDPIGILICGNVP